MSTADRVAILLGQMIQLLRADSDESDDLKSTLRTLVEIVDKRSLSIRADAEQITVEGIEVEGDDTLIGLLLQQMQAHLVAEMRVAHSASAIDVMHLVRGIALDLSAYEPGHVVDEYLKAVGATTVSVVSTAADASRQHRRDMRITDVVEAAGLQLNATEHDATTPEPPPVSPQPEGAPANDEATPPELEQGMESGLISEAPAQSIEETLDRQSTATMSETIAKLEPDAPGAELLKQLETVQASITKALDEGHLDQAIDAVAALVRKEAESEQDESRRAYGVALRRLLTEQSVPMFADYLLDDLYAADVELIVRRAGQLGTAVVLELLAKAETYAERKACLHLLRDAEEGLEAITGMLAHPDWVVIRNMADLAGELKIEEAVPALGKVVTHEDARARTAAGVALARIGVSAAVPPLRELLKDADPDVRVAVFSEVGGKGLSALAMPFVAALADEEDPQVRAEYFRAMGRLGTSEAIESLKNTAGEKTGLLKRKMKADALAAIEGLALANSPHAIEALEALKDGGSKSVREAASNALRDTPTS